MDASHLAALVSCKDLAEPCRVSPEALYLASLSTQASRSAVAGSLARARALLGPLPWHEVRREHLVALVATLSAQGYAARTVNHALAAVKGVLKQCWLQGTLPDRAWHLCGEAKGLTVETPPTGRHVPREETSPALRDGSPRARALLAVLLGCGLRRSEAAGLDAADLDAATGELTVRGKGNKTRLVYAAGPVLDALRAWLALRGPWEGALFVREQAGGSARGRRRMTGAGIGFVVGRAFDGKATPHDLRRTFVGSLLDAGVDLATVQALAGHSDPATTARYDRRPLRRRAEACAALSATFV